MQDLKNQIEEALDTSQDKVTTPLLEQEEIEDQEPPRINLTAVVCTAIVAVCATIILLVARPWKSDSGTVLIAQQNSAITDSIGEQDAATKGQTDNKKDYTAKAEPDKEKPAAAKKEPEKNNEPKNEIVKPTVSSLPVVKTTKTGTSNPYNSIRLIDASSRKLTKSEVEQMSKEEMALARNSIYARHGYQFNNPDLKEFFAKQSWFKPSDVKIDEIPFSQNELDNIRLIKAQETKKQ